jgi:hypothetical protein
MNNSGHSITQLLCNSVATGMDNRVIGVHLTFDKYRTVNIFYSIIVQTVNLSSILHARIEVDRSVGRRNIKIMRLCNSR